MSADRSFCLLAWKVFDWKVRIFCWKIVRSLVSIVQKLNWNVFENLCQFSGFQVVYSERTLRLTDFETTTCTTWSQSTLSESLAESTKVYTWSQSTDRLTSRLRRTTWSRSTGLPGKGWEASHKFGASVDVSKTHRTPDRHRYYGKPHGSDRLRPPIKRLKLPIDAKKTCTTWSRSARELSDRPASLEKVWSLSINIELDYIAHPCCQILSE